MVPAEGGQVPDLGRVTGAVLIDAEVLGQGGGAFAVSVELGLELGVEAGDGRVGAGLGGGDGERRPVGQFVVAEPRSG